MNWNEDDWFAAYHAPKLTEEFKAWWVQFYGVPSGFDNSYLEQHEYWLRCAFALSGWLAAGGK